MPHLASVARKPRSSDNGSDNVFPFSVPTVRSLTALDLRAPVTFFVGENGSGKSTVLEGIAAAAGLPAVGSADLATDATLGAQRALAKSFKLSWTQRTPKGFFLRAEDFFGFAKRLAQMRAEFQREIAEREQEYEGRSAYA